MSWAYDGTLHERQNTMDVFNNGKSRPISWPLHDGEIELCSQGTFDPFFRQTNMELQASSWCFEHMFILFYLSGCLRTSQRTPFRTAVEVTHHFVGDSHHITCSDTANPQSAYTWNKHEPFGGLWKSPLAEIGSDSFGDKLNRLCHSWRDQNRLLNHEK